MTQPVKFGKVSWMIRLNPFFICGSFWNIINRTSGYWSKTTVPEVQYVEFIYVPKAWNTHGILLREANVRRHRPVLVDPAENQLIIITGIPEYLLWLQRRQFQAYNNRFRLTDDWRITTHFLSTYHNFSWIYLHVATVQQTFILTFLQNAKNSFSVISKVVQWLITNISVYNNLDCSQKKRLF
jgi:hypothetical protein